jgi:copper oxidase (laccase) domain-containing protein
MEKEFGVVPGNVLVGIGPSLGPEDFFIRSDVKKKFDEAGYKDMIRYISKDQWLINIWEINKQELIKEGVSPENIELSGISTYTSDKFFSYRRKNPEGHFITGVMLK